MHDGPGSRLSVWFKVSFGVIEYQLVRFGLRLRFAELNSCCFLFLSRVLFQPKMEVNWSTGLRVRFICMHVWPFWRWPAGTESCSGHSRSTWLCWRPEDTTLDAREEERVKWVCKLENTFVTGCKQAIRVTKIKVPVPMKMVWRAYALANTQVQCVQTTTYDIHKKLHGNLLDTCIGQSCDHTSPGQFDTKNYMLNIY